VLDLADALHLQAHESAHLLNGQLSGGRDAKRTGWGIPELDAWASDLDDGRGPADVARAEAAPSDRQDIEPEMVAARVTPTRARRARAKRRRRSEANALGRKLGNDLGELGALGSREARAS